MSNMTPAKEWTPYAKVYDPLKCGSIDGTDTIPHDRALIRAMNAEYKPSGNLTPNKDRTIFVSRLNHSTKEDTLLKIFERFGDVTEIHLIKDIVTGFSKGYAFIEFRNEREAIKAYESGHKREIDGREVLVDYENERTMRGWVPRRLGGGFSGKKEAGQLRFGSRDRPFRKPIMVDQNKVNQGKNTKDRDRPYQNTSERFSNRSRDRDADNRHRQRRRSRSRSRDRYRNRSRSRSRSQERSKRGGSNERQRSKYNRNRDYRRDNVESSRKGRY